MKRTLAYPAASPAFDWMMGLLAALVVAGIFQDGWAHNHGLVDQSFFTPWHAILYGTMALNGLVLLGYGLLNLRRGYSFRNGLPYGYWLSAIGVALFLAGGLLDLWWHTVFGIEEDLNALISPTHLLLALAATFVVSGPIRSVAKRVGPDAPARWRDTGPVILASASIVSLLAFFTMYANPIGSIDGVNVIGKSDRTPVVGNIYVMRADGSQQTRVIVNHKHDAFGVAVAPDGKWIAYRTGLSGTNAEIFSARTDGSGQRQLTHTGRWATQPAWSPDGRRIAFVSTPIGSAGNFQLVVMNRDGSNAKTLVDTVAEVTGPAWSADGSRIAYETRNGTSTQIASVAAAGGTPSFIAGTLGGSFPAFSRNGKLLAFTTSAGVAIANADGSNARLQIPNATMPAFSPKSDRVAFAYTVNGIADIGVAGLHGISSSDVSLLSGMSASRPAWSPDGRIFYSATANGNVLDTDIAQAFAVDGFLISSVLLMGALLVLVRRFALPFGAITVLVLMYAIEQATQQDHYFAIAPALMCAILGDLALARAGARFRSGVPFYAFAFTFSLLFSALFIVTVNQRTGGLGWPADLTYGTPLLAGFAGLLTAFCCAVPLPSPAAADSQPVAAPSPSPNRESHAGDPVTAP